METGLEGVPETMLWTLHNRASEARRDDGIISDPECLRIYEAIDYDYERSFGRATASPGVRSYCFDQEVLAFAREHPTGWVINLAEGLETQRYRLADLDVTWMSVDLPEAMETRRSLLPRAQAERMIPCSALDPQWLDALECKRPPFNTALGLFMYFEERDVETLVRAVFDRFAGARLLFDSIPPWFSHKTTSPGGLALTPHYTAPRMPWGIRQADIAPTLRRWAPSIAEVRHLAYKFPRGRYRLMGVLTALPVFRDLAPCLTFARAPKEAS